MTNRARRGFYLVMGDIMMLMAGVVLGSAVLVRVAILFLVFLVCLVLGILFGTYANQRE